MINQRATVRTIVLGTMLSVFGGSGVAAQNSTPRLSFRVTAVAHSDTDQNLTRSVVDALRAAVARRGFEQAEHPNWVLLVGAEPVDESPGGPIALSLVALSQLPEPAVAWAALAEIAYATVSAETRAAFPTDGKWVREQFSEDFIRQFGSVQDHVMAVVNRSALRTGMEELLETIVRRNIVHIRAPRRRPTADSTGAWPAELTILDAAGALDPVSAESLRRCASNGLASMALENGASRIVDATGGDRLYFEVSILEHETGLTAYLTLAFRSADGRLAGPVDGVPDRVSADDSPGLCTAIRDVLSNLRLED